MAGSELDDQYVLYFSPNLDEVATSCAPEHFFLCGHGCCVYLNQDGSTVIEITLPQPVASVPYETECKDSACSGRYRFVDVDDRVTWSHLQVSLLFRNRIQYQCDTCQACRGIPQFDDIQLAEMERIFWYVDTFLFPRNKRGSIFSPAQLRALLELKI